MDHKQHLRIKAFYGTSVNAVKTQGWIAISVFVLVAILKEELHLEQSLYALLQILSVILFERVPMHQALVRLAVQNDGACFGNQLPSFDL